MKIEKICKDYDTGIVSKSDFIKTMYDEIHSRLYDLQSYIGETDIVSVEINDKGVIFRSRADNLLIYGLKNDRRIAPIEILNFKAYEKDYSDVMLSLVEGAKCVVDIGANAGWYSMLFAKRNPMAKIIAFEPIPNTYDLLRKNIKLNGLDNIEVLNLGLSDEIGNIDFYYSDVGSGAASMRKILDDEECVKLDLHVVTADSLDVLSKECIDFIKCDVEGAELKVFKGAELLIKRNMPIVLCEMLRKWSAKYEYHPNDLIQWFSMRGYGCFSLAAKRLVKLDVVTDGTEETNFFFLHLDKHRTLIEKLLVSLVL